MQAILRNLVENIVRIEGTVVIADAGMVAPNDQMGAAEILSDQGMQERFARAGIAHFYRVAGLNYCAWQKIVLDKFADCLDANIGWNVTGFERAKHLMDEQAIANLDGDLGQVLMASVHGIAGLKCCDPGPTQLEE